MSFSFGQLRKNNTTQYLNVLSVELQEEEREMLVPSLEVSKPIIDQAFNISLNSSKGYFIKLKIYKQPTIQSIKIKLINTRTAAQYEQSIDTIIVPAGSTSDYFIYEKVFMPMYNYDKVRIELKRTSDDYFENETRPGIYGRIVDLEILSFAEVNNIIPYRLKRIGVQGTPGLLMCVNGEQIQIGKSGLFEINIEYTITFLGMVIEENSNKHFILDYQY